ncbi:bifunctional hydroxymethylpyrimidine kinase/phosphomethylpyrimidine kinase [Sphingomonas sp. 1P06PA]|uniref:bifunctional hydroxymethylpyrimidine kinase/phosphomethylpyrimidine kinase n=1 Tax=Sphingomonas sp. 1P06PA TaxID=554121 RepID=UPI0039A72D3F
MSIPRVLIIAGSDSGGGAGIQADIKTVTVLGGHAMTAITAITAQNTLGVQAVQAIPAAMVIAQIDSVLADLGADAVKIGMIGSVETLEAVADRLDGLDVPIVLDPVMVASSGGVLADASVIAAMRLLMARATLVTPNLPELDALGGLDALRGAGATVLVKGGHAPGDPVIDRLVGPAGEIARWSGSRIETRHNHGTGCTLASGIATGLAEGLALKDAVTRARQLVRDAMLAAPGLGGGHGPMGHGLAPTLALNQVTLPARDYSAAVDFYRRLGLFQIVDAPPRYARFELPNGATLSIHVDIDPAVGDAVVYLECGDLDERAITLAAAGVIIDQPPRDERWLWREARLRDPTGNQLCLYQAGLARRFPPWRLS